MIGVSMGERILGLQILRSDATPMSHRLWCPSVLQGSMKKYIVGKFGVLFIQWDIILDT